MYQTERLILLTASVIHGEAILEYYTVNKVDLSRWEPARGSFLYH